MSSRIFARDSGSRTARRLCGRMGSTMKKRPTPRQRPVAKSQRYKAAPKPTTRRSAKPRIKPTVKLKIAPIELSKVLKSPRHSFRVEEIVELFKLVDERRVDALAAQLTTYIRKNLPAAFEGRDGLADYRTNPYVLMTSANVMKLTDMDKFGAFLFNSKLYMALETSFGKSVESAFTGAYPLTSKGKWEESREKRKEFDGYAGLNREEKAQQRTASVWREVD